MNRGGDRDGIRRLGTALGITDNSAQVAGWKLSNRTADVQPPAFVLVLEVVASVLDSSSICPPHPPTSRRSPRSAAPPVMLYDDVRASIERAQEMCPWLLNVAPRDGTRVQGHITSGLRFVTVRRGGCMRGTVFPQARHRRIRSSGLAQPIDATSSGWRKAIRRTTSGHSDSGSRMEPGPSQTQVEPFCCPPHGRTRSGRSAERIADSATRPGVRSNTLSPCWWRRLSSEESHAIRF